MAIPLRTNLFSRVLTAVDRMPIAQQAPENVRAASDRRRKLISLPGAWLIVGRPDRRVHIANRTAELADGSRLPLRGYQPVQTASSQPVIVYFHGGGFVSGDPKQSEWWCAHVAAAVGAVVVSVDYRLAPEHPFPAGPEDCYAGLLWTVAHADELGVDASRLAVAGDSAGANLAAVVSLMARDRGGPPIALQVLIYPVVELVEEFASERENAHAPMLTKADIDGFNGKYCARQEDRTLPYASPLRADHRGLPPALVQTAEHDPLRDQGAAYAAALRRAGVAVRLSNYADAVHGYISIPRVVPVARQALAEAVDELRFAFERTDFPVNTRLE